SLSHSLSLHDALPISALADSQAGSLSETIVAGRAPPTATRGGERAEPIGSFSFHSPKKSEDPMTSRLSSVLAVAGLLFASSLARSEEHTSELQSRVDL